MRLINCFISLLLIFCFMNSGVIAAEEPDQKKTAIDFDQALERKVEELNLTEADLGYVVKLLYDVTQLNLVVREDCLHEKVTLKARNLPARDVVELVAKAAGLNATIKNGAVFFGPEPVFERATMAKVPPAKAPAVSELVAPEPDITGLNKKLKNSRLNVIFEETPLVDILRYIGEQHGINIVLHDKIREAFITINLLQLKLGDAISLMCLSQGLKASVKNNAIFIEPADSYCADKPKDFMQKGKMVIAPDGSVSFEYYIYDDSLTKLGWKELADLPLYIPEDKMKQINENFKEFNPPFEVAKKQVEDKVAMRKNVPEIPKKTPKLVAPAPDKEGLNNALKSRISFEYHDFPIENAMRSISMQCGINILSHNRIRLKNITATVRDLPLSDAIALLCASAGLKASIVKGCIFIEAGDDTEIFSRRDIAPKGKLIIKSDGSVGFEYYFYGDSPEQPEWREIRDLASVIPRERLAAITRQLRAMKFLPPERKRVARVRPAPVVKKGNPKFDAVFFGVDAVPGAPKVLETKVKTPNPAKDPDVF